jgi:Lrp/AsnC family transcriptional regulator for asnA, asnC and gidA
MCYYVHNNIMTSDWLDEQLINLLMQDARKSSDVLAEQLNVSSSTIRRRIKKLVEQGKIHIIAVPEPGKIGLPLEAVIALDVAHENISVVMESLNKHPQVRWLAAMSGQFDIMAYVWCHSTEELYKFIETEVGRLEGLKNSETFICLHVSKHA